MDRRQFMQYFAATGAAGTLFPGVLWATLAAAEEDAVTAEMIAAAEKLAGLEFTEEEREDMARGLNRLAESYQAIREVPLPNSVPPALRFDPVLPGMTFDEERRPMRLSDGEAPEIPNDLEEMAFWNVRDLGQALRERRITSTALTRMYLERLKRFDPLLHCVITLTEERALDHAARADAEIASGRYRGPLHGIPWGAKDLLAAKGYRTTWGAKPYENQTIDEDATVVQRLDEAGAVLAAKLTLGALAMGDRWYGERTRNPWNPKTGSSGSSAGPASAVAAGLVGFAIGSETNGSIASPASTCGVTGLRPTFGRVSRHGAMALSWSMDKLGPMARTVEDCAIVLDAVHGPDGHDSTVVDLPFNYDATLDVRQLRVGYVRDLFAEDPAERGNAERTLDELREIGIDLVPIDLPDLPFDEMGYVLSVEAAAAFDELTRSNRDDELVNQAGYAWPNRFRQARMVPAVEWIQANRVRTLLMREMQRLMEGIDLYVTPARQNLYLTNFTGHPLLVLPNGFDKRGMPTSIGFVGTLFGEAELCALGRVYENASGHHRRWPDLSV